MEEQSSCANERQLLHGLTLKADDSNNGLLSHKEALILNHLNQDQCINASSNNNQGESLDGDCSGTSSHQQTSEMKTGKYCNEYEDTIEDWQEPSSYHLQLIDYNIKLMTQGSFNLTEKLLNPSTFEDFGETEVSNSSEKSEANQISIFPFDASTETSKSHSDMNQLVHPSTIAIQDNQQQEDLIHHIHEPSPLSPTIIEISSQESWNDDSNDPDLIYSSTASYSSSAEETVSQDLQLNSPKQSADKLQESTIPEGRSRSSKSKMDSFERFFGSKSDFKLHPISLNTLKKREECTKKLIPDVNIFQDLNKIKEWRLSQPIPLAEQLTVTDINRIKRGMVNGRLYNFGLSHLRRIFPDLSLLPPSTKSGNSGHSFRCPLCPKSLKTKDGVYYHIESLHTMSLNICLHCRTLLSSQNSCFKHRCLGIEHSRSRFSTSPEPTGAEANSLIITKSHAVSVDSRQATVKNSPSKMKENSFKRYFGSKSDCKPSRCIVRNLERREERIKDWVPDENVFIDLDKIEEWDLNKPIPSAEELTPADINRIKKGMANGQLYNIGPSHIKKIFPNLSSLDPLENSAGSLNARRLRCPLCPKHFRPKYVYHHIEILHTKSLYVCIYCHTFFIWHKKWSSHRCDAFLSTIDQDYSASKTLQEPVIDETYSLGNTGSDMLSTSSKESTLSSAASAMNESSSISSKPTGKSSDQLDKWRGCDRSNSTQQRLTFTNLTPDESIFKGLDGVKEWNGNDMIPAPGDLTYSDVMRIRKGMVNGRKYNINQPQIKTIFPDFPRVTYSPVGRNHHSPVTRFKCPLCSRCYSKRENVCWHIQRIHSLHLVTSVDCEATAPQAYDKENHQCENDEKFNGSNPDDKLKDHLGRVGKRLKSGSSKSL